MVQLLLIISLAVPQLACLRSRGAGSGWMRGRPRAEGLAFTQIVLPPPPATQPVRTQPVREPRVVAPAATKQASADDKPQPIPRAESSSAKPPTVRLPRYYAQLELEATQSQQVLEIQQRYAEREAKLQEELKQLEMEREQACKQVLNRAQQRKLSQLQGARDS
jgi:hypothetical protein